MKNLSFLAVAIILAATVLIQACSTDAPSGPTPGLGNVTINKYVSVGNSLTAGYQSNGLYESAQIYSYPNIIANQLKKAGANIGTFQQPIYSDPGNPDPLTTKAARFEIISLVGPVIGPRGINPGAPTNATLARPYDNLGMPAIPLAGYMDTTGTFQGPFKDLILRYTANPSFPKSVHRQVQALAANPTTTPDLVTFWLGNNDVLGFATSGGVSPNAPTPTATFQALYTQAMTALRAALPNARIVVANIPDVTSIPFFTTVNPRAKALIPAGAYLRYQKNGNTSLAMDSTNLTEANPPLLTLRASAYATLLGQPTGKWYRDLAATLGVPVSAVIGAGIDTTKQFGFHPQNPLPDALVLDAQETATARAASDAFNAAIAQIAATVDAPVVDANGILKTINEKGHHSNGVTLTSAFVTGGMFSLDGVHPSSRGAGVMANEFIKVINAKWGASIPQVDLNTIPAVTAPIAKAVPGVVALPDVPLSGWSSLMKAVGAGF